MLVKAGAKANLRDKQGNTPLHFADDGTVAVLVQAGCDPNAQNAEGRPR